jgi:tRNA 2-thiouridine synthesizing protein A
MSYKVDARGLSCPQPVVLTKNALDKLTVDVLEVLVDDPVAKENVLRFCNKAGCRTELITDGEGYLIRVTKPL